MLSYFFFSDCTILNSIIFIFISCNLQAVSLMVYIRNSRTHFAVTTMKNHSPKSSVCNFCNSNSPIFVKYRSHLHDTINSGWNSRSLWCFSQTTLVQLLSNLLTYLYTFCNVTNFSHYWATQMYRTYAYQLSNIKIHSSILNL